MSLLAVFLLSCSTLYFEIVLTRFFSLSQGAHLAFLVIGLAMLGSAGGGAAYALSSRMPTGASPEKSSGLPGRPLRFGVLCLAAQVSICASFVGVRYVPLDYLRFPVDGFQFLYLVLDFLMLALPFFLCGFATCAAYGERPEKSGALSLASMSGSAAGAITPLLLFPPLGEGPSLLIVSSSLLVPAVFSASPRESKARFPGSVFVPAASAFSAIACLFLALNGRAMDLPLSQYKALSQMRRLPGTREIGSSFDIRGRIDIVESPSFRFAPGLSLNFDGSIPKQTALLIDGASLNALFDFSEDDDADFALSTLPALGYGLAPASPRSLILQRNGGTALARAFACGSREITVLLEHPAVAAAMRERVQGHAECLAGNARSYLARTDRSFDVIEIEDWGSTLPGMESLSAGFLYTVDSFRSYFRRLSPEGIIIVPRRLLLPPQDILRLFASASRALEAEGIRSPESRIVVGRSWDASVLIISRSVLEGPRLSALRDSASENGFDLDWFPGIRPEDANRYNRFKEPYHFEAIQSMLADPSFASSYPLDVAAQGDDRPFPSKFLKWTEIRAFFASTGKRIYALLLSGETAVLGILCAVILVSIPLILVTALAGRRKRARTPFAAIALFASCGLGFLFAEIAFLDGFGLLWGNPSLCLAIVLAGMLSFSGSGGIASRGLGPRALRPAFLVASAAMAAAGFLLRGGTAFALGLPPAARLIFALAFLAVPSFLLGLPFPAAIRLIPKDRGGWGLCWAVNGAAAVLASILAAPLAISWGIRALALCSALAYCAAAICAGAIKRRE